MSKINERITEFKNSISLVHDELNKRIENLNNLTTELESALVRSQENQDNSSQEIGKLENEIKLLESNIENEKSIIANLKDDITKITPELASKSEKKGDLEKITQELASKSETLENELNDRESHRKELQNELNEKEAKLAEIEAEIETKVSSNKAELEEAKKMMEAVVEQNQIWDFLFNTMEMPEIEIMAIISLNRNIGTDNIKSEAKSVSPVFVGRALSKLEADGKIAQTPEGNWDLSQDLLNVIK